MMRAVTAEPYLDFYAAADIDGFSLHSASDGSI